MTRLILFRGAHLDTAPARQTSASSRRQLRTARGVAAEGTRRTSDETKHVDIRLLTSAATQTRVAALLIGGTVRMRPRALETLLPLETDCRNRKSLRPVFSYACGLRRFSSSRRARAHSGRADGRSWDRGTSGHCVDAAGSSGGRRASRRMPTDRRREQGSSSPTHPGGGVGHPVPGGAHPVPTERPHPGGGHTVVGPRPGSSKTPGRGRSLGRRRGKAASRWNH